jgi:hypothetical protein
MKTRKTREIKLLVAKLKKALARLPLTKIRSTLRKMGYYYVDSGGFKTVYKKKAEPVCVKVYRTPYGWQDDSYKVPKTLSKHYLHPVYKTKKYIIQEWANGKKLPKGKVKYLPSQLIMTERYDLRDDNIRIHNGKEVVIDFCNY